MARPAARSPAFSMPTARSATCRASCPTSTAPCSASGGLAKIRKANLKRLKAVAGKPRLGPCVGTVRNFIAIGLNYADHAAESGVPVPDEPVVFNKAPSCICGPNDDTMIPKGSSKLDYECELAVIIGKRARYLAKDKAMDAVAGYCISNDVSERAFQMEHGQTICKGKGCETFGPLGPWLVSKDEIRNPQKLAMWHQRQRRRSASAARPPPWCSMWRISSGTARRFSCWSRAT